MSNISITLTDVNKCSMYETINATHDDGYPDKSKYELYNYDKTGCVIRKKWGTYKCWLMFHDISNIKTRLQLISQITVTRTLEPLRKSYRAQLLDIIRNLRTVTLLCEDVRKLIVYYVAHLPHVQS